MRRLRRWTARILAGAGTCPKSRHRQLNQGITPIPAGWIVLATTAAARSAGPDPGGPDGRRWRLLNAEQESLIRSLPLERLEGLAEALLDFEGMTDLNAWLAANA